MILMPLIKKKVKVKKSALAKVEGNIVSFLKERKDKTYTSQEIMEGVNFFQTDFSTAGMAKISTFAIVEFNMLLYDLCKRKKIGMKVIGNRVNYTAVRRKKTKQRRRKVKLTTRFST